MALEIFNQYQPRANAPDADYPTGSLRDKTSPTDTNGTPLTVAWGNDYVGFTDALLNAAGITHNGLPDTVSSSQRLDAINILIANALGIIPISGGGILEVNKRYWIMDSNNYILPDVTGLSDGTNVSLYRIGGITVTPTLTVDGTNSEQIDYFNVRTGLLLDTDVSATYNIAAPLTLIFNETSGNWEI